MINVQAVAEYLASTTNGGGSGEDTTLIASLLTLANSLATQPQGAGGTGRQPLAAPGSKGGGAGRGAEETPPEIENLAEGIKLFVNRYPVDSRAYEYLVTSPATVVAHVLRDFRPPREGEADYSRIITTYVKRIRSAYAGISDFPPPSGPNQGAHGLPHLGGPGGAAGSRPPLASPGAHKPVIVRPPPDPMLDPSAGDYSDAIQEFVRKYPVDDRAYNFLANASPAVQLRVLQEFKPHRMGDSDYSALLTTFTKKSMDAVRAQEGAAAYEAAAPVILKPAAPPLQAPGRFSSARPSRSIELPPEGVPRDLGTAMVTPGLDDFLAKFPLDERAYDYFAVSSPEVQLKVLQEFHPTREGEASYSGLFTSFVKKCRTAVASSGGAVDAGAAADDGFQFGDMDNAASFAALLGEGANPGADSLRRALAGLQNAASAVAGGAPLDLDAFRLRYPMDDRAFDFLNTSTREVQERVTESFVPQRPDDSDFSAAITAYVRSLRHQAADGGIATGVSEEAVGRFFERYPCDARAVDYFNMCTPDVQAQVMRDFRPRSEGDADYSAAVTAYVKSCRNNSQRQPGSWRPPQGGWGPPKRQRMS